MHHFQTRLDAASNAIWGIDRMIQKSENPYDQWRKCWEEYLLGREWNPAARDGAEIVDSLNRMADAGLYPEKPDDDSWCCYWTPYYGLHALAMAYRTPGTNYYGSAEVREEILGDLEKLYETDYNPSLAPEKVENWWGYEIGMPLRILDILILMYDEIPGDPEENSNGDSAPESSSRTGIPKRLVRIYTDAILHFRDVYGNSSHGMKETGANLVWKCQIMLLVGILRREDEWIDFANDNLVTTMQYAGRRRIPGIGEVYDDGFYPDGSFIQHYMFAYTGGYGKNLLNITAGLLYAFRGQTCLRIPQTNIRFFCSMVEKAYAPLIWRGHFMDVARGREPSRFFNQDDMAGAVCIRSILYLEEALPGEKQYAADDSEEAIPLPEYKQRLAGRLKEWLSWPGVRRTVVTDQYCNGEYYVQPSLQEVLHHLDQSDVPALPPLTGNWNFGVMCKPVHRTRDYALAISMYSKNIACYERLNTESTGFWHMGDGVTYLYDSDPCPYNDDYYATADLQRLPGTTVERSEHRAADPYFNWYLPEARNVYDIAGGTELDGAAIAGMHYRGQGNGKERTLDVKKSWFMCGKRIICLGSGITSDSGNDVETILMNRKIRSDMDESALEVREQRQNGQTATALHLDSTAEDGKGISLLVPMGQKVSTLVEERTGTWNTIQTNPANCSTRKYATVWMDHGNHVKDASYCYEILPETSLEEALREEMVMDAASLQGKAAEGSIHSVSGTDAAKNEGSRIFILENSPKAAAVYDPAEQMLGIMFWENEPYTCCGISSDMACCALIHRTEKGVRAAVADPSKKDKVIHMTFGPGLLPIPAQEIEVDTRDTLGAPVILSLS